jgi:hypothetical protein
LPGCGEKEQAKQGSCKSERIKKRELQIIKSSEFRRYLIEAHIEVQVKNEDN